MAVQIDGKDQNVSAAISFIDFADPFINGV